MSDERRGSKRVALNPPTYEQSAATSPPDPEPPPFGAIVRCNYTKQQPTTTTGVTICHSKDASTQVRLKCTAEIETDEPTPTVTAMLTMIMQSLRTMHAEQRDDCEEIRQMITATNDKFDTRYMRDSRSSRVSKSQQRESLPMANFADNLIIMEDSVSVYSGGIRRVSSYSELKCPDMCPRCGRTIRMLLAEIDELRRSRQFLLHVRYEANEILDEVIEAALANRRVKVARGNNTEDDLHSLRSTLTY